jgi:hypothetical protein
MQSKFFVGAGFRSGWWAQMNESVQQALAENAHHGVMERYLICTPRTLTKQQRERWDELCLEWMGYALTLGYSIAPEFEHWGYSELEARLLQPAMRGQLLYWFGFPNFHRERCAHLNRATVEGLHERFMPGLHTPTDCEAELHRFLRTERFWQEFVKQTREGVGRVREGGWMTKDDWPKVVKPFVEDAKAKLAAVLEVLGDGCHFPASLQTLAAAGANFDTSAQSLYEAVSDFVEKQESQSDSAAKEKSKEPAKKLKDLLHDLPSLGGWTHYLHDTRFLSDAQCVAVLGPAGEGKTHTLAEIVTEYEKAGGCVLFVEGRAFTSADDPWTQFLRWADFGGTTREFLDCFSALAASSSARAGVTQLSGLICVDALNETPTRNIWLSRLDSFAAELRAYPNLKLLVSCRTDFADLTLPLSVRNESNGWRLVHHQGLGAAVFDAAPRYLAAYNVRGADVLAMASEMQNPLFLKTFCEAFKDDVVPPGTQSLPGILKAYVARKSDNIAAATGCSASVVREALRELAQAMHAAGHRPLPETQVRALLRQHHTALDEAHSLYRGFCSEGLLHELRESDHLGDRITVRFAYERVWDYMLTLHLLPPGAAPTATLLAHFADARWCFENENLLSLLVIRLPEEGHGEIHDLARLTPGANYAADSAFLGSIRWRTRGSFSARTEALWDALRGHNQLPRLFRLSLAPLVEHPWNAGYLHAQLAAMSLGDRDRRWTMALNQDIAWEGTDGVVSRLLSLSESAAGHSVSDEQSRLLGIALAWICSTTAHASRHRASYALARLLRTRPSVITALVEQFKTVNDPQVFEAILYAAAACAAHSTAATAGFGDLVQAVHTAMFAGSAVPPNVLHRHYAQVVCEQAEAKGVLPGSISTASFRPPFRSQWPQVMSEADEAALEAEHDRDYKATRALGSLLSSTRTEQMTGYGDWGRYQMGARIKHFQRALLTEPAEPEGVRDGFDDRIARRYLLGRVLELGLDKASEDKLANLPYEGRSRPSVERLGKKYQWIAFYEILGYLTDHHHYCEYVYAAAEPFRSAVEFGLPDLLDPVLTEQPAPSTREDWPFAESTPWWVTIPTPYPSILSKPERFKAIAAIETPEPAPLLRPGGNRGEWLALAGIWEWNEPVPCWVEDRHYNYGHACVQWHLRSYAVPTRKLSAFTQKMLEPVTGGGMIEDRPTCARSCRHSSGIRAQTPRLRPNAPAHSARFRGRGSRLRSFQPAAKEQARRVASSRRPSSRAWRESIGLGTNLISQPPPPLTPSLSALKTENIASL